MLEVTTDGRSIHFGERFALALQRTLRIPDDGEVYPLPPGLGAFPVFHGRDYAEKLPEDWGKHGGVFIPMYQREALWINFGADYDLPHAVKVAVGKSNAVSGKPWDVALHAEQRDATVRPSSDQELEDDEDDWDDEVNPEDQDYLVCPPQPWLDGINAGKGFIKQFVAMPLGMGYTVEGQLTGKEEFGGIQLIVYAPKPGRFPEEGFVRYCPAPSAMQMGLGAGGRMKQKIYRDEYGIDTWDQENYGRVYVHILNSMMFREVTGLEPPPTPVTVKTYQEYGLPWFDVYDEKLGDIEAADALTKVKTVKEMDKEKGFGAQQDDSSVDVPGDQVIKYPMGRRKVTGGSW